MIMMIMMIMIMMMMIMTMIFVPTMAFELSPQPQTSMRNYYSGGGGGGGGVDATKRRHCCNQYYYYTPSSSSSSLRLSSSIDPTTTTTKVVEDDTVVLLVPSPPFGVGDDDDDDFSHLVSSARAICDGLETISNNDRDSDEIPATRISASVLSCADIIGILEENNNNNNNTIDDTGDKNNDKNDAETLLTNATVVIALGVTLPLDVRIVATLFRKRRMSLRSNNNNHNNNNSIRIRRIICQLALGGKPFAPLVGSYDEANPPDFWQENLPFSKVAADKKLWSKMQGLLLVLEENDNNDNNNNKSGGGRGGGEVSDYVQAIRLFLDQKRKQQES